ncbi:helix-turn-helix transcriptional regulator [Gordonia sp. ABSL1-1]|uniref:helix-turn-helix transcriptional regulator n=1 Tax=Gordonia sp. ABSL1-1 TaxID=3053923 RepID=UPI002573A84F|nr:helix-turn-helix transcriptional regulator [Gordonia sp. ABSL1-1]MDL9935891.1 helix-turn-helix transcriptional regulator [Gordonia sp. ABSL1-1]
MAAQVGSLLRQWRATRSISQLDLAYAVGVSPRHLSFVETGKSRPSATLIDALSRRLDIPLRERNVLLLAAGHAPRYSEQSLDDAAMTRVRKSVQRILDAHNPNPGVALDRVWNVVLANDTAAALTALLPPSLTDGGINMFRASLHPDGFASYTVDFEVWAGYLLDTLRRLARITGDRRLADLDREVSAYPNVAELDSRKTDFGTGAGRPGEPTLLVPFGLRLGEDVLRFFTTHTTFGTPRDITLEELTIELFYPADDASEARLAMMLG